MAKTFGMHNVAVDARQQHVLMRQGGVRTTSALDYLDQLVTLHYGTRVGICSHFREATVAETGMAWAGAPFGVPAAVALADSILTVTTTGRAFIYQNMLATNTYDKLCSVALVSSNLGDYAGLRLDDGTDNNYLEIVLRCSQASPSQWTVRSLRRAGGGAVTTQDGDAMCNDPGYVLRMEIVGAYGDAWNGYPGLHTNMGFGGLMYKPYAVLANSAFTPTRAGIVFYAGVQGEENLVAKADWFDIGRS